MQLNFIKEITILACKFEVVWDKDSDGGSFDVKNGVITIGVQSYKKDPVYTFSILSHELMECILTMMGARWYNPRDGHLLFNFNHQTFENAIEIHSQSLVKFIKK